MKIAIAKPHQVPSFWFPFSCDFLAPREIREHILEWLREEEDTGHEISIVTMNRTVLDMVTSTEIKNPGLLSYEDVLFWNGDNLVPLLDVHDEEWLVHFSLGDLFEREEIPNG